MAKNKLLKRASIFFLFLVVLVAVPLLLFKLLTTGEDEVYTGLDLDRTSVSYEEVTPGTFDIRVIADKLGTITRIKISPDGQMMLVTDLSGSVWAFKKEGDTFVKQEKPFFVIDTNFTGFPNENGLTGLAFGADFKTSKDIFLLYAIDLGDKGTRSRITRLKYKKDKNDDLVGTDATVIFEGNVNPSGAHQIQNAVGVMIRGKPHLLFSIGENYKPEYAKDLSFEAGKFMLIQSDGSIPLTLHPYPTHPKIVAVGIRNVYGFDVDQNDPFGRVAFLDNGPNVNDRFVYAKLIDEDGAIAGGLDFNWNGEDGSVLKPVTDVHIPSKPNSILYNWGETLSPDEIIFYPGRGIIPTTDENTSYALVLLFGKTGTAENEIGKEITLAKIERKGEQPVVSFTPLIRRSDDATDFAGNPLGLAYDPTTLKIYFGDLIEGRIYELTPREPTN